MSSDQDMELVQRALENNLSQAEFDELQAHMRSNQALLDYYCESAKLHHDLIEEFSSYPPSLRMSEPHWSTKNVIQAISIAAAVAISAIFLLSRFNTGSSDENGSQPIKAFAHMDAGPEALINGGRPIGKKLYEGETIDVNRGKVKLTLQDNTTAVVEGPATIQLKNKHTIGMTRGRIWAHVSDPNSRFTIVSPYLTTVDLGTEFGVIARENEGDSVHVFKGSVEVTTYTTGTRQILRTGESFSYTSTGVTTKNTELSRPFSTTLPHQTIVLDEDFSTRANGKLVDIKPRIGGNMWKFETPAAIEAGQLTSKGNSLKATYEFTKPLLDENNPVLHLEFAVAELSSDKQPEDAPLDKFINTFAGLTLHVNNASRIRIGRLLPHHAWWSVEVQSPEENTHYHPLPILDSTDRITVRYNYFTGKLNIFPGNNTAGSPILTKTLAPRMDFTAVSFQDLSERRFILKSLKVSTVGVGR